MMLSALIAPILLAQITAKEIFAQCSPFVVTVKTDRGQGSGFVASETGLVYTAAHVVEGASEVKVTFSDGTSFESTGIVDADVNADVAIFKARFSGRSPAKLAKTPLAVGDKVFSIGAPLGLEFSITDGIVSQYRTDGGVKLLQHSCGTSPGNSGGPIFNSAGEVIGVHTAKMRGGENANFAVDVSALAGLDQSLSTTRWTDYRWKKISSATNEAPSLPLLSRSVAIAELWKEISRAYEIRDGLSIFRIEVGRQGPAAISLSSRIINGPDDYLACSQRIAKLSERLEPELKTQALKVSQNLAERSDAYKSALVSFGDARRSGWNSTISTEFWKFYFNAKNGICTSELALIFLKDLPPELQTIQLGYRLKNSYHAIHVEVERALGTELSIANFPYILVDHVEKGSVGDKSGLDQGDIIRKVNGEFVADPLKTISELLKIKGSQFKLEVKKYNNDTKTLTVKVPK